jgi:hypothetical protein
MTTYLPEIYERFSAEFPSVMTAYTALAEQLHAAGPLSARERRLAKLGIAIGEQSQGGVRSHAPEGARGGDRTGGYPPGTRPGYHHGWLSCRARRLPVDQ